MARENIPALHYPGKVRCWFSNLFAIVSNCSCTSCAAIGNISGFCMISYIHTKQLNRSVTLIKWITAWFHCMHAMLLLRLKEAVCQNDDGGIYLTVVMSPVPI